MVASAGSNKPAAPRTPRVKGEVLPGVKIVDLLNKPTRPPSAFNLFMKERLSILKKQGEDLRQPFKKLGSEWKNLDPNEKAKFVQAAKSQPKIQDYVQFRDLMSKKVTLNSVLRSIRESGIVKRPRPANAWSVFLKENWHSVPSGATNKARLQALADKWRRASEAEKQEFQRKAVQLSEAK